MVIYCKTSCEGFEKKCIEMEIGNQIRPGMSLDIDGRVNQVVKCNPVKPGKGGAYMQVK